MSNILNQHTSNTQSTTQMFWKVKERHWRKKSVNVLGKYISVILLQQKATKLQYQFENTACPSFLRVKLTCWLLLPHRKRQRDTRANGISSEKCQWKVRLLKGIKPRWRSVDVTIFKVCIWSLLQSIKYFGSRTIGPHASPLYLARK